MRVLILGGPYQGDAEVADGARSVVFPLVPMYPWAAGVMRDAMARAIEVIELPIETPLSGRYYGGVVTWTEEAQRAYEWAYDHLPPSFHSYPPARRAEAEPVWTYGDLSEGRTIAEIVPDLIEEIDAVLALHKEETDE